MFTLLCMTLKHISFFKPSGFSTYLHITFGTGRHSSALRSNYVAKVSDLGSSLSCLVPLAVLSPMTTWLTVLLSPATGFSVFTGESSVTTPSYTYLVSLILRPAALRKFFIRTSVFLISGLNTSLPTIGQNGT